MSSLFRRKLDELEDMFITSQDDLLARFASTYEENKRLKAELEMLRFEIEVHREGWDSNDAWEYHCKLEVAKMRRDGKL